MTGKVLVVGDKAKDGRLIHDVLKKESGLLGRLVSKTEATHAFLIKFKPDILVLNPDDGFAGMAEYYHTVKKDAALADIPVVAVLGESDLKSANLPAGIQDVFCRPVREAECAARLLILYRKFNRLSDKNVIRCGDLEIDVSKYEVRVGDRKVDLTYTEYELLKFLATHPDNVFTRDVLLNKVWGYEYYGGARTVDVHIRRLRAKIEYKNRQFIDTVRNIGYKFISPDSE